MHDSNLRLRSILPAVAGAWFIRLCLLFTLLFASLAAAPATALAPSATPAVPATSAPTSSVSTLQKISEKARVSWPWYVSRASGLVAVVLLFLLVFFGIGLYTGFTYRYMEPLNAWKVHRAVGIALGVAIFVHVFSLLFDTYVGFGLLQLLVPFVSQYQSSEIAGVNVGSLDVALGILAFYVALIIIVTSLLWRERKAKAWRLLHYLAYLLVPLVFLHALTLGTDISKGLSRYLWLAGSVLIVGGVLLRLKHIRSRKPQ